MIRATSQNAEMVHALGIDVNLVRSAVFGIGCGLAGAGGVLAAPLLTASIGMAAEMIIDAFVIVIIGGMGSFAASACPLCRSPEARICDRDREFESRFLQQRVRANSPIPELAIPRRRLDRRLRDR